MRAPRNLALLACWLVVLVVPRAQATTVVVPDQYPTIQGAIDSGADVIQVRDGSYPERLVLGRSLVLQEYPDLYGTAFPSVLGMRHTQGSLTCHGIRFRGAVSASGTGTSSFESCRFDSGLTYPNVSAGYAFLRGCLVIGTTWLDGSGVAVHGCSFIGGGVTISAEGWMDVTGNYVEGPAATGIRAVSREANGTIADNLVVGVVDGISLRPSSPSPDIVGNEVRGCSGVGYRVEGGNGTLGSPLLSGNAAVDCGGRGIESFARCGTLRLEGNRVTRSGGDGIFVLDAFWPQTTRITSNVLQDLGGGGIVQTSAHEGSLTVSDNRVIGATGDGIRLVRPMSIERNVVGRCGGTGIVVDTARAEGPLTVRGNTVYWSGGAGYRIKGVATDTVDHNIADGAHHHGFDWTGAVQPVHGCNDWYANVLGPTDGLTLAATDLQVNPLFCDVAHDSVGLSAGSPLVAAPSCGRIGALGVACASPLSVVPGGDPGVPALRALPQPARGEVEFSWNGLAQAARLEIYDVSGARRWSRDLPGGPGTLRWSGIDASGRALPAGVYFARLSGAAGVQKTRIVLVR